MNQTNDNVANPEIYNVDYFIRKFSAIPEEKWTTGIFRDINGARCALGHCGVGSFDCNQDLIPESAALRRCVWKNGRPVSIVNLNDGYNPEYQQSTPKQRILAFLRDAKATQTA